MMVKVVIARSERDEAIQGLFSRMTGLFREAGHRARDPLARNDIDDEDCVSVRNYATGYIDTVPFY